jgi:5-formyltetrahydrofolate cyclo-ligase
MSHRAPDERKALLRARAKGSAGRDRSAAALSALEHLTALPEFARARTAAFYVAIGDEVPVEAAAERCRAAGARTVYPVVVGSYLELAPDPAGATRARVEDVDVFVVPGVLFDREGRRLGRGGGHYDRLLARRRADATLVGICYADRVIDELPQDPWDVAMHAVVTELFVLRFGRASESSR